MSDPEFTLLGDAIWLDFINTALTPPAPRELLHDPAAYHRWTKACKLVSDADDVPLEEILRFRRRLLSLAQALDGGKQPPSSAIQAVNRILDRTAGHHQLTRVNGAWRLRFTPTGQASAMDAIAQSAAASLADPLVKVRRCTGDTCSFFFADQSPNHSRRWCSRVTCGDRLRIERRRGNRITPVV
ncbi:MAG: CGNR zinc finger domain-containing protein [Gemmatimonadales bacterium]